MNTTRPAETATVRRQSFTRPKPKEGAAAFVLAVVSGPDAGKVLSLDASGPSRALLGQSPVCVLRLSDAKVSRRHASVSVMNDHIELRDLGSTNGTTVNGVLVKETIQREAPRFVELTQATSFGKILGESPAMRKLYPVLASLAASEAAVLLEGETGTGKSLVAEELHTASRRKDGPFVSLETSALASSDIGNRLFGFGDDAGLLAAARGGVLFIDEIGNLPRDVQARLRDVLEGSDVRLVAATRRDLDRDVQNERFDERLFFVLASGRVELPALREREGDVASLAKQFWAELAPAHGAAADLPEDFLPRFEHYPWPGNVRELRSAVVSRMTLGELGASFRTTEAKAHGLDFLASVIEEDLPFPAARERVVMEFERRYVERVLARHGGNVTRAARASGVAHRYFQLIRARLK